MTLYSVVLGIHITTAVSLILMVIYSDHLGILWMRGKHKMLPARLIKKLHTFIYAGLAIMILTGLYMFLPIKTYLLTFPTFLIKMGFLVTLCINSIFVGKLSHIASVKSFSSLSTHERAPLYISGAISTISWIGVIVAATQLGL